MYSKCKRSSLCQDQINSINQSFRSPPHPFRSLELHFQTILQGLLHGRFYVSLPCGNFPQKHHLRWRVRQWTLQHSTVRRAFSSVAPGDGLHLLRDLPMLTHYDLSYICNPEVMSVYVLRIFFTSAKTVRTAIVLDNSKGLCLETTSRRTRGYQQCN